MRPKLFSKLALIYIPLLILLSFAVDIAVERDIRNAILDRHLQEALISDVRVRTFIVFMCIAALGAAAFFLFSRRFSARVRKIRGLLTRMGGGEFRPIPIEGPHDELTLLAESANTTAEHLGHMIRSLGSERDRSSAILRSMVEGVGVIDAQEHLVFWNRAFAEILNMPPDAGDDRPVIEVVRNTAVLKLIRAALKGEESLKGDITTGIVQLRMFAVTAAPVRATDAGSHIGEKPSGAVVVLHDVTELRRLERVRQDFVANVSHEFKTPLTAIQGFAETLLGGALEDQKNNRRFLEIIRDHAAQLARVTDDLLKLARIEAGKLEVQLGPVNVADVIDLCAETTSLRAQRKGIVVEAKIPPDLPMVRADARLLREVLQNLLDNAVQYTPSGGKIELRAEAGPCEVTVAVTDTGIGIPLADQERIFERFYRVDAARSREVGGTGLGLSIARHIVETLGGRLSVQSEVGRGSRFSFSIPKAA